MARADRLIQGREMLPHERWEFGARLRPRPSERRLARAVLSGRLENEGEIYFDSRLRINSLQNLENIEIKDFQVAKLQENLRDRKEGSSQFPGEF